MAELEPGHPDELVALLRNWLTEAHSPVGVLLPEGIDPLEWVARRFIASWSAPVRAAIEELEHCLQSAESLCGAGNSKGAQVEIGCALQLVGESLRGDLGLYSWNKD